MGKGKGAFEYWACRANMGKVIFEIGGPVEIRMEVAKEALRWASAKLPVPTEFVTRESAPRIGNKVVEQTGVGGRGGGGEGRCCESDCQHVERGIGKTKREQALYYRDLHPRIRIHSSTFTLFRHLRSEPRTSVAA